MSYKKETFSIPNGTGAYFHCNWLAGAVANFILSHPNTTFISDDNPTGTTSVRNIIIEVFGRRWKVYTQSSYPVVIGMYKNDGTTSLATISWSNVTQSGNYSMLSFYNSTSFFFNIRSGSYDYCLYSSVLDTLERISGRDPGNVNEQKMILDSGTEISTNSANWVGYTVNKSSGTLPIIPLGTIHPVTGKIVYIKGVFVTPANILDSGSLSIYRDQDGFYYHNIYGQVSKITLISDRNNFPVYIQD